VSCQPRSALDGIVIEIAYRQMAWLDGVQRWERKAKSLKDAEEKYNDYIGVRDLWEMEVSMVKATWTAFCRRMLERTVLFREKDKEGKEKKLPDLKDGHQLKGVLYLSFPHYKSTFPQRSYSSRGGPHSILIAL